MPIELTEEEKQYIRDLFNKEQKQKQRKTLDDTLWTAVEALKDSNDPLKWKKIKDLKTQYYQDLDNL
jgi:hypothetical protein